MPATTHQVDALWGIVGVDAPPRVRPATADDEQYINEAFEHALKPYYGGDHTAHAHRLLTTQLRGGDDPRKLLSTRQQMHILWSGEHRVGLLNLAFKRQTTCKISPLILFPDASSSHGYGAILLHLAEQEARRAGARQLYCTVSQGNKEALAFFRQFGFTVCGYADDQYLTGQREVLLRRPLSVSADDEDGPGSIISVTQVDRPDEWRGVQDLMRSHALTQVDGVTPDWIDSLWSAATADRPQVWVLAARDRLGRTRAAAVASRKKGDAIKIMPIVSRDADAFRAVAIDLPSLLHEKGRKVYMHIVPDVAEVAILQEAGWACEAHLPGAYCATTTTQQWAYWLDDRAVQKNLRIRKEYFNLIRAGKKSLELRVGYKNILKIRPGDELNLVCGPNSTQCHVQDVRTYHDFHDALTTEDVDQALPGMSADEAVRLLRTIYPADKEKLGVVVLELKVPDA